MNQFLKDIEKQIPFLSHLKMQIIQLDLQSCQIKVPLSPHTNHKGTAFGGSLYVSAVATSYLFLHHLQKQTPQLQAHNLVIAKAQIDYLKPVKSDFIASLTTTSLLKLKPFERIPITIEIKEFSLPLNHPLCLFQGEFVFTK